MKIAILMETSGKTREAFRKKGHDVVSVDLLPSDDNSPFHIKMDVMDFLMDCMCHDLIIAHPTCTKLCVSGNHVYAFGKPKYKQRLKAIEETANLWDLCKKKADKVCFENPVGVLYTMGGFPKPQYIQPNQFGHDASKKTGLFLHNLPKLEINPGDYFPPRIVQSGKYKGCERWGNQTDSGQNKLGPSKDRWKIRSETYDGISNAFANQWV